MKLGLIQFLALEEFPDSLDAPVKPVFSSVRPVIPVRPVRTPVRPVPSESVALRSSCPPPAELDFCSAVSFETYSTSGAICSIELADVSSTVSFSILYVKSEFLLNLPSFLT